MDTKNCIKAADPNPLADIQSHKVIVGIKQLKKALNSGMANTVFLAENADPVLTEPLAAMCRVHQVSCVWVSSMHELGHACGIDVGAAAAAVVD